MDMVDLSILTEITILEIGLMESGQVTDGLLINLAGSMKGSGSTVNSWEIEICIGCLYTTSNCIK